MSQINIKRIADELLETPWLHQQVDTHLFFGLFARYLSVGWIVLSISLIDLINLISTFLASQISFGYFLSSSIDDLLWLFLVAMFCKLSKFQQAVIAWIAVKCAGAFLSFMFILSSLIKSIQGAKVEAVAMLGLGLIWMPWIEFIPKISVKQKYVTIARLILSMPFIMLGINSGNWYW